MCCDRVFSWPASAELCGTVYPYIEKGVYIGHTMHGVHLLGFKTRTREPTLLSLSWPLSRLFFLKKYI